MRVLLLAADCNPEWPSLPVVGFNACRAIGRQVDAVIATHIRNKPAIQRKGIGPAEVVYLDNEYIAAPMYKAALMLRGGGTVGWTTNIAMAYPPYLAFEYEVWKHFKGDLQARRFDIVHRVTPMSPTLPSPLARWTDVPFVLGPLNGGLAWPPEFTGELKREKEWLTHLRAAHRLLPYYASTYKNPKAILAAFGHTIQSLPETAKNRVIDFPEVGIDPEMFDSAAQRPRRERVTFLFAGRLVPYKCADVAVAAFAASSVLQRHKLLIVGEGPERPRLEEMIREKNLETCVELAGKKTQAQVGQLMREADVFAFPSIRELGAGVVVEAMACGLPCVVVDYGGPGGLINAANGVKVPLGGKPELIQRFAAQMERLIDDAPLRSQLGAQAHRDAMQRYSWDAKASRTIEVYKWVLGRRADKPDFYHPHSKAETVVM